MVQLLSSKNSKSSKRYAKALLELSGPELSLDKIYDDILFVSDTVAQNLELKSFLAAPVISKEDKKNVLDKIFKEKVNNSILNFLFLLNENSRLNILDDICISFKELFDRERNICNVYVTSAIELNDEQKNNLKSKLEYKLNKTVDAEYMLDSSIFGGLIIKINDTVIDLSLKKRIENLAKNNI